MDDILSCICKDLFAKPLKISIDQCQRSCNATRDRHFPKVWWAPTSFLIFEFKLPSKEIPFDPCELSLVQIEIVIPPPQMPALLNLAQNITRSIFHVHGAVDQVDWSSDAKNHLGTCCIKRIAMLCIALVMTQPSALKTVAVKLRLVLRSCRPMASPNPLRSSAMSATVSPSSSSTVYLFA